MVSWNAVLRTLAPCLAAVPQWDSNWYLSSPDESRTRQDTAGHNCRYARGPELTRQLPEPSSARYARTVQLTLSDVLRFVTVSR